MDDDEYEAWRKRRQTMNDAEYEAWRAELRGRYVFYIMNPPHTRGVEYSLWIREPERDDTSDGDKTGYEYPIMSSNTGGFTTFNSRHQTVGDGIRPSEEFFTLLGVGFHEAMCFMPHSYFEGEHFETTYLSIYADRPRLFEVWAAQVLITHFALGDEVIPELQELAKWSGSHTEFGVSALNEQVAPELTPEGEQ